MGLTSGCRCVIDPYYCLQSEEYVTQLNDEDGRFRSAPQPHRENELSVFRGRSTLEEALARRIRSVRPPFDADLLDGRVVRFASVRDLRDAGFGVVHTPAKKIKNDIHCSIVLPPLPDDEVLAEWPTLPIDFPALLDSLFEVQVTQEVKK
ncbi:hypothetical protein JCM18882A_23490 [Brevibacterium metallidurans]|uniref:RES domain-containing protein n=1 Tax=Brevibacterium metallidurans TaxID=1482676 RepID=A0ABP3CB03_9MICO